MDVLSQRKKVIGAYESTWLTTPWPRLVLLENGITEAYLNGKKYDGKWKIVDGEIHTDDGDIGVWRINKDRSITHIANIDKDGKRKEIPKGEQTTFKRIK